MSDAALIASAILWLSVCVLAKSDRDREICMVGTIVLMALLWVVGS